MTAIERLQARGIRRLGGPKSGFRYRTADGHSVADAERRRITALRIPPAWTDVAISPSPTAPLQAIGRDAAGRWQYRYHDAQVEKRETRKRERLVRFLAALPRMRRVVARDLALPGLPRERVLAGTLRILSTCFLRPGSEDYVAANGSFGLATLRARHVRVRGSVVAFDFRGKSGQRQRRELEDPALARLVRELLRHPGEVFKYRNGDGVIVDVKRRHINEYIKQVMGEAFSAKDFRTWAANLLFASSLARSVDPADGAPRSRHRAVVAAMREVAEHLGNTPAVCRKSYVFDSLVDAYEHGGVVPGSLVEVALLARPRSIRVAAAERSLARLLARSPSARPPLREALQKSLRRLASSNGRAPGRRIRARRSRGMPRSSDTPGPGRGLRHSRV